MSVDHRTTTHSANDHDSALDALDELVRTFEEAERKEVREYEPSAWLEDMKAFDVAQHTLRQAQKLVDVGSITNENLTTVIDSLQARFDEPSTTDEQKAELANLLDVLYAAQSRVGLMDETSAGRYSYFAAEYFMRSQDMDVLSGAEDSAAASDPAMLRAEFQSVLQQMQNDARVYAVFAQRFPRQS